MTMANIIKSISSTEVDKKKATKLQKTYATEFPEIVLQMVTYFADGDFAGDYRFLSFNEVIHAEADLHVPFRKLKMIPLVDCGDNDFIAYSFGEDLWLRFNVVEEVAFGKKKNLSEILK